MKQADLKHKNYSIYSGSLNFQTDVTKRMSTKHLSIGDKIDEKTQNVHLMNTDTGIRKDEENGRKSHVGNKSATEKGGMVAMTDDCGRYNDGRGIANETSAYTCKDKHLCESSRLVSNTRHATKSTDTRHASENTVCVTQEAGLCTKPTEEETKVVGVYNTMEHFDGNGSRVQCVVQKNMTTKATIGKFVPRDDIQSCEFREESSSVKESELTPAKKDTGQVKPHLNAVPYSEEWLAAIEAFGEDILEIKTGTVQNSPTEKALPGPSPWSPVIFFNHH
ncbi:hypothetical protein AXF42_Ash008134 [Apostasia shenzhenica]|uniref:Uncharacterized protein n=1 Tax=Apostasia shenzhenica TaxID=1088818 RepID=A0A2I0A8Q7_9ASPA|nr:hypothetical protein AXF42_Ash008134 [Apostasia shenzhenica]